MVILHIARVSDDPYNGVCNVVPMHVISQQAHIEVALLNITPNRIENIKTQFTCEKKISDLPEPFNKPDLVVFHEIYFLPYLSYSRESGYGSRPERQHPVSMYSLRQHRAVR